MNEFQFRIWPRCASARYAGIARAHVAACVPSHNPFIAAEPTRPIRIMRRVSRAINNTSSLIGYRHRDTFYDQRPATVGQKPQASLSSVAGTAAPAAQPGVGPAQVNRRRIMPVIDTRRGKPPKSWGSFSAPPSRSSVPRVKPVRGNHHDGFRPRQRLAQMPPGTGA